jgi:hypothetical protein
VRGRRAAVLVAAAAALSGCAQPVSFGSELAACADGDDGTPSNGVVLMAQAVRTASWVPCLEAMPVGWHFADLEAQNGSARFWLDSDRFGMRAIEVRLTESCSTEGATEIPSDRDRMRRFERVTQVSPDYVGQRLYRFAGGCITVVFTISGEDRSEPLAVATQALGAVHRDELRELVREQSDGRLELDPPAQDES